MIYLIGATLVALTFGFVGGAAYGAREYRRRWRSALAVIEKFQPELDEEERLERRATLRRASYPHPKRVLTPAQQRVLESFRRKGSAA